MVAVSHGERTFHPYRNETAPAWQHGRRLASAEFGSIVSVDGVGAARLTSEDFGRMPSLVGFVGRTGYSTRRR